MKAILKFNLPEDRIEFEQAAHAGALASALSNMDNDARNFLKHGHSFVTPDQVLVWVRENIREVHDLAHGEVL